MLVGTPGGAAGNAPTALAAAMALSAQKKAAAGGGGGGGGGAAAAPPPPPEEAAEAAADGAEKAPRRIKSARFRSDPIDVSPAPSGRAVGTPLPSALRQRCHHTPTLQGATGLLPCPEW